jgi:hypothetical protein
VLLNWNEFMTTLRIDKMLFIMAFERDVDYEDPPQEAYLDLVSGGIEWLIEEEINTELFGINAAENKAQRDCINGNLDRFLLIPGLSHDDHHDILRSFLASNWTNDNRQRVTAQNAYTGSIGRWKKTVADPIIIRAFQQFRDRKIVELAEEFLAQNKVKVEWR